MVLLQRAIESGGRYEQLDAQVDQRQEQIHAPNRTDPLSHSESTVKDRSFFMLGVPFRNLYVATGAPVCQSPPKAPS